MGVMKTTLNPTALYWASFNRFELRLPGQAVLDIAQSGSNDVAVARWVDDPRIEWSERVSCASVRAELSEYGAWDESQLADNKANRRRILWQAAWQIAEDDAPDFSAPVEPVSAANARG